MKEVIYKEHTISLYGEFLNEDLQEYTITGKSILWESGLVIGSEQQALSEAKNKIDSANPQGRP